MPKTRRAADVQIVVYGFVSIVCSAMIAFPVKNADWKRKSAAVAAPSFATGVMFVVRAVDVLNAGAKSWSIASAVVFLPNDTVVNERNMVIGRCLFSIIGRSCLSRRIGPGIVLFSKAIFMEDQASTMVTHVEPLVSLRATLQPNL